MVIIKFLEMLYNEVPIIPPQRPLCKIISKRNPTRGLLYDYTQPRKQTTDKKKLSTSNIKEYTRSWYPER